MFGSATLPSMACRGALGLLALLLGYAAWRAFAAHQKLWHVPGLVAAMLAPLLMAATYTGLPIVMTNAQFALLPSWQYLAVLGSGSIPPATRRRSGSCHRQRHARSAPGAGDVGSEVPTVDSGCFNADFPAAGADIREWGSSGIQAAVTAMANNGRLIIDAQTSITLTAAITAPTNSAVDVEGVGGQVYHQATTCPSGVPTIIAATSTTAFNFIGARSVTIKGICFQMATTAGTATAGSAIAVGGTSTQGNDNDVIAFNTILNAYDGITVGGATTGTTQTNGVLLDTNFITSASDKAISLGALSSGISTTGVTLTETTKSLVIVRQ